MNHPQGPRLNGTDLRWLRWSLTAIAVLLAVIAVELSALIGPLTPRALAQSPPDSGAQRQEMIQAQRETNRLLQQVLDHLRNGEIKVALPGTDKGSSGTPAPRRQSGPQPQTAPRVR